MNHAAPGARSLLRRHGGHQGAKVTMVELFFDLVFVFAVTQLSHLLLARLTPLGALQTVMLLLAVWSVWNYTAWATNALDPGRIARIAYSFLHMPIVAGVIVSAVGDELVLVHPEHADAAAMATVIGGSALFVLGCTLFKWISYERRTPALSHMAGLFGLGALWVGAQAHWFSTLQLGMLTSAILIMVAVWETLALRRP